jgi:hypothetical protein
MPPKAIGHPGDITTDDIEEFIALSSAREETERKEREESLARDEAQVAEIDAAQARTAAAQARTAPVGREGPRGLAAFERARSRRRMGGLLPNCG